MFFFPQTAGTFNRWLLRSPSMLFSDGEAASTGLASLSSSSAPAAEGHGRLPAEDPRVRQEADDALGPGHLRLGPAAGERIAEKERREENARAELHREASDEPGRGPRTLR